MLSNSRSTSVSPIRQQARCRTPLSVKSNNTNHSGTRSRSPSRSPSRSATPLKHKPSLIYSNSIRLSGLGDENFPQLSPSPKRHMKTQVLPSSPLKRTKLYASSSSSPSKQAHPSPLNGSNTIFSSSMSANPSPITSRISALALSSSLSTSSSLSLSSTTSAQQQNQTHTQSQNPIQQKLQKLTPTPFKIFEDPVNHKTQTNASTSSQGTPNMDLEDKENNSDITINSKDTQLRNNKQHSSTKRQMLAELHILEYPGYIQLHNVAADSSSSSLSSDSSSSLSSGTSPKKDTFSKEDQMVLIRQLK
ncbi:unnamed protein product [Ambrosiozyma monospora]|uniref:Unnamed protein product n=1 Tax=Ambrosiozyma monospora TaxID=43982 RepID=A0A9W6Z2F5_AMBMO|nr:unnamed protein product [Ambrosiozyma monospora]